MALRHVRAAGIETRSGAGTTRMPVLIELFTSELLKGVRATLLPVLAWKDGIGPSRYAAQTATSQANTTDVPRCTSVDKGAHVNYSQSFS